MSAAKPVYGASESEVGKDNVNFLLEALWNWNSKIGVPFQIYNHFQKTHFTERVYGTGEFFPQYFLIATITSDQFLVTLNPCWFLFVCLFFSCVLLICMGEYRNLQGIQIDIYSIKCIFWAILPPVIEAVVPNSISHQGLDWIKWIAESPSTWQSLLVGVQYCVNLDHFSYMPSTLPYCQGKNWQ